MQAARMCPAPVAFAALRIRAAPRAIRRPATSESLLPQSRIARGCRKRTFDRAQGTPRRCKRLMRRMAEVAWTPERDALRLAGLRDRGSQRVGARIGEQAGPPGSRKRRCGSVASIASASTGGNSTQSARLVFVVAARRPDAPPAAGFWPSAGRAHRRAAR
jgi:hypothetical protein